MRLLGVGLMALLMLTSSAIADANADARQEARTRISPVVAQIVADKGAPVCGLKAGETYTIAWSAVGYGYDYNSTIAIFDCTNVAYPECGAKYADTNKIIDIRDITPFNVTESDWNYKSSVSGADDVNATRFDFNVTVTIPSDRTWTDGSTHGDWNTTSEGGNQLVVRFYQKADNTTDEMSYVSLIIGARAQYSYGDYSRRIYNVVATDTDPDAGVCPLH